MVEGPRVMRLARSAVVVCLALGLTLVTTLAQEDLYGPSAPPDAAYFRVVNAASGVNPFEAVLGDLVFPPVAFAEVTPYFVLEPATLSLSAGDAEASVNVEAGGFYTAALLPGGLVVFDDEPLVDASRALLTFYNLSGRGPLDLATADGETDVLVGVGAGESESIVVGGAEVALGVFEAGELVAALESQQLERGAAHSVFAFDGPEGLVVGYDRAELQE